jgi:hypothetical protein
MVVIRMSATDCKVCQAHESLVITTFILNLSIS